MPDRVSFSKKAIHYIDQFERVSLRVLEAADKISFRLLVYALAVWEAYKYFIGKH
jgi:hypothetical protein